MHEQIAPVTRHRFTRADYHTMARTGILPHRAHVELMEGEIVETRPIGPRHGSVVDRLNAWLSERLKGRAICRVQGPLAIGEDSEPQPDLQVLRVREDYYSNSHPKPNDVLLLIEVGETSIEIDRGYKLQLYARADVPEYWIVDVERRILIVHRDPRDGEYGFVQQHDASLSVAPQAFGDLRLELAPLFSY